MTVTPGSEAATRRLADMTSLLHGVTPDPLTVVPRGPVTVVMTEAGGQVGVFTKRGDAEFFTRAVPDLRTLSVLAADLWVQHRPAAGGTTCERCSNPSPCPTRQVILAHLAP